jgi:hypothetical protein
MAHARIPRLLVSTLLTVLLFASLTAWQASAAQAAGTVRLDMDMTGAVSGAGIIVAFTCQAHAQRDGDDFPDPHWVRVRCGLTNGVQSWDAPQGESFLVPAAVTGSSAYVPFDQVNGLRLCGVAEAEFVDGYVATDPGCVDVAGELPIKVGG